jgi:ribosomal protein S18 acetylase RimI-like enzyme
MEIEVVRAGPGRVPELAALLGRAFADDPMMTWCFGADAEARIRRMFEIVDGPFAREGWLWETTDGAAVAMWVPPGSLDRYHAIEDETDAEVSALTHDGGEHERALWDWIGEHLPDEPQWYLDHLAVDVAHRGRGAGAALVREGTAWARDDGIAATLETARPSNVSIYEHLGFRVYDEGEPAPGGPHIWLMRADPRD